MVGALRKLTEKNLGNLTPHPLYSGFYYSHPTFVERAGAISVLDSGRDNRAGA
jgi:STE24 endopeptidase